MNKTEQKIALKVLAEMDQQLRSELTRLEHDNDRMVAEKVCGDAGRIPNLRKIRVLREFIVQLDSVEQLIQNTEASSV